MSTRIFRKQILLGASATDSNVLSGTDFEYPPGVAKVIIGATGVNTGATMTVKLGSRIVAEDLALPVEAAAGRGPLIPDDVLVSAVAMPTERIQVAITNDGAGTADPTVYVEVNPIG